MATQMGILSYRIILALTVLTALLPILTKGNAMDQRVLQREIGESSPEIISMNDKDDFRELEEPAVNDYDLKPKIDDQSLENAFFEYLYAKRMMNKLRARQDLIRAQKKRSYWKQCAFNAVSCFG